MLYVGQVEEKEDFTYEVKGMWRHGEVFQFAFANEDNMNEIEREDIVVKHPQPISLNGTARATTLKYRSVNFLRKELCRQRNSVLL